MLFALLIQVNDHILLCRYAVFGLGSSAYPNFCAFAHSCRNVLHQLGGKEIHTIGEGDELSGQDDSFKKWAKSAFKVSKYNHLNCL